MNIFDLLKFFFLILIFGLSSCGNKNNNQDTQTREKENRIKKIDINDGSTVTFNQHFSTRVNTIKIDQHNILLTAQGEFKKSNNFIPYSLIELRNHQGNSLRSKKIDHHHIIQALKLSKKTIVTAQLTKRSGKVGNDLSFTTYDEKLNKVKEIPFAQMSLKKINCSLDIFKRNIIGRNTVQMISHNNFIYISVLECHHIRLIKLNSDLKVVWDNILNKDPLTTFYINTYLTVLQDSLFMGLSFNEEEAKVLKKSFPNIKPLGGNDILLLEARIDTGEIIKSKTIGSPENDHIDSIASSKESLILLSTVSPLIHKDDGGDVQIISLNSKLKENFNKRINIKNMDDPSSIEITTKEIIVVGRTDFKQVKTGSIVQHGNSFIMILDLKGNLTHLQQFGTARDDKVLDVKFYNNKIYLTGYENGPITHDGDKDPLQNYFFGFLKIINR